MTVDEAFERATAEMEERISVAIVDAEEMLRAKGVTAAEVEDAMNILKADLTEWRAIQLPRLHAWLERGGEVLH